MNSLNECNDKKIPGSIIPDLFLSFFKIGLFTFGGGLAMLALIEEQCVEKKHWITHDEMMYVTIIAESTPGPIAINCATFVGYQQAGLSGALAATVGVVLPSFFIIYLISMYLNRFLEIKIIANAFKGIKAAVGIIILDAAVMMIRKMNKDRITQGIMLVSFAAMFLIQIFSWNFSSISLMIIAAIFSLALYRINVIRHGKEKREK
mgnify:FL=1